jgi:hypothetical protein
MAARTRVTREPPERTGPIRRAGMGSSSASQAGAAGPVTPSSVVEQGIKTARMMARVADGTVKGVVERSVDNAYTVIDEYMTRGRDAAGRRSQWTDGRYDMSQDPQFSTWGPNSDFVAPWWQMMRTWADGMAAFMFCGPAAATTWLNACARGGTGWAGSHVQAPKIEPRVSSKRHAAVTVSLQPGAESMELTATGKGNEPTLPEIKFDPPVAATVRGVNVTVPDDLPAGPYTFTISDENHNRRGELRVDVRES